MSLLQQHSTPGAIASALRRLADAVEAGVELVEVHSERSREPDYWERPRWHEPLPRWVAELRVRVRTTEKNAEIICQDVEQSRP